MAAFTTLVIGSLLLAGTHGVAATNYVALGDSYAAGVGTSESSGDCGRSPQSYPDLYASKQGITAFHDEACSGATIGDVVNNQLGDLSSDTSLVSITVGGTDIGFSDVMTTCVTSGDSACVDRVHQAEGIIHGALGGDLTRLFQAIQAKAPNAKLVVLGYPHVVETGGSCLLSETKRQALNDGADQLAEVTREQTTQAGAVFADARPAFAGHGYCGPAPWINGVELLDIQGSFHPDDAGQRDGYLPLLANGESR